jgi:CheY-like chemotaxis protein
MLPGMDKKLLIIGQDAICKSLRQVLGLFGPYEYEYIDTGQFQSLTKVIDHLDIYKDSEEIGVIILPDSDGIELSKHIRLTDSLGRLRQLPIIILIPCSIQSLLSSRKDNIFLLSPGCFTIEVREFMAEILSLVERLKPFSSPQEIKKQVEPFVIWSDEDEVTSKHDNFNRYGPMKLMGEQFETLPPFISNDYEEMKSRLWFKKYAFLENDVATGFPPVLVDEEHFQRIVAGKRALYIDDEHRLGWSFALYHLFTQNGDIAAYQLFKGRAKSIETPDKRFTCIDNFDDAWQYIESCRSHLTQALSEYSVAEHQKNILTAQYQAARDSFNEVEAKLKIATQNLERAKTNLERTSMDLKELHEKLKHSVDALADAYVVAKEVNVPDLLPDIGGLANIYDKFASTNAAYLKYKEEFIRIKDVREGLTREFETREKLLRENEVAKSAAVKRYDSAQQALQPWKIFSYDLVICDLRLRRVEDKKVPPSELSGVKLIKLIKEFDPTIPVLVFTASEKALNFREVTAHGASGYWIKSVDSLAELKDAILKAIVRALELRNLWLQIKKVEVKKCLLFVRENLSTRLLERNIMDEETKNQIVMLLKESFLLLIKEPSAYEEAVCNFNHYGRIALNMGMIQEERFGRIQGEKWDQWVRQKKIDSDEAMIRQTRNRAAHQVSSRISYNEAHEVFQKTLEKWLRN